VMRGTPHSQSRVAPTQHASRSSRRYLCYLLTFDLALAMLPARRSLGLLTRPRSHTLGIRSYATPSIAEIKRKWASPSPPLFLSYLLYFTDNQNGRLVLSEEVEHALAHDEPIIALESAIITHGSPLLSSPSNLADKKECPTPRTLKPPSLSNPSSAKEVLHQLLSP
jgi:hypothetical protein